MIYPEQSKELLKLLKEDQSKWSDSAKSNFEAIDTYSLEKKRVALRQDVRRRARRMLQILNEIKEPSLTNIGAEAAQAISILALHDSVDTLERVLAAFTSCYENQRNNTYHQSIPSMTDWMLILHHKPQRFGTFWLMDKDKEPFLPTVKDFKHVNERRAEYDIEPLHWPKSASIPASEQPWLKRPLSELVMRDPTSEEFSNLAQEYLN